MEKARQYSAVRLLSDHKFARHAVARPLSGENQPFSGAARPLYLDRPAVLAQNMDAPARDCTRLESLLQHCAQFALEVFENKAFLPIVESREVDIALSWGQGGEDRSKPCTNRGRQIQWYKDFLLSRLRRSWRLLPFRAAKTVRRCNSHQMQQHNSRSITTSWFTSAHCFGRAFGPVLPASFLAGGADG